MKGERFYIRPHAFLRQAILTEGSPNLPWTAVSEVQKGSFIPGIALRLPMPENCFIIFFI